MAADKTRLGRSIKDFDADIKTTSDYIIVPCPPPVGQTNGSRLGWTTDEMAKWADIRARWDAKMVLYNNKKGTRTTEVTDNLKLIINEAVAYERAHRLYDRIAVSPNATTSDFEAFHIKRSTPLATITHRRAPETGTKRVFIALKGSGHLFHKLLVTSTDKKGRGMEDGVSQVLLYKAITVPTAVAPAFEVFQHIGNVKRSLKTVTHTDAFLYQKAWYVACVENSNGEIGVPSDPVGFIIT